LLHEPVLELIVTSANIAQLNFHELRVLTRVSFMKYVSLLGEDMESLC
jgi:hypothetical protein